MKITVLLLSSLFLGGCASHSIMPDKDDIKVSRKAADKECESLGKVEGRIGGYKANREKALEDLKMEAANKGANYVQVKQYSDSGTSVTGLAYKCN